MTTITDKWTEGDYVLLVDRFSPEPGEDYERGDTLSLDEFEALRLGEGGAIAPVGSMEARRARAIASGDPDALKRIEAEVMKARAEAILAALGDGGEGGDAPDEGGNPQV